MYRVCSGVAFDKSLNDCWNNLVAAWQNNLETSKVDFIYMQISFRLSFTFRFATHKKTQAGSFLNNSVELFIMASAVGMYGANSYQILSFNLIDSCRTAFSFIFFFFVLLKICCAKWCRLHCRDLIIYLEFRPLFDLQSKDYDTSAILAIHFSLVRHINEFIKRNSLCDWFPTETVPFQVILILVFSLYSE